MFQKKWMEIKIDRIKRCIKDRPSFFSRLLCSNKVYRVVRDHVNDWWKYFLLETTRRVSLRLTKYAELWRKVVGG